MNTVPGVPAGTGAAFPAQVPEPAGARARQAAGRAAARELVAEYEREHGPLPEAARRRARAFLAEAGLLAGELQRPAR